jgi:hypothetical protein
VVTGSFVLAVSVGVPLFVLGVLVSAVGQILAATLDTAVTSSPFLTKDQMAQVMSLDTMQSTGAAAAPVSVTKPRPAATATGAITEAPRPDEVGLMEQFQITFDGEKYHFGEYRYESLADAVNFAKLQARKRT